VRSLIRSAVLALAALGASAVGGLAAATPVAAGGARGRLSDDFESYQVATWAEGSTNGPWYVNFNGGGRVNIANDGTKVLHEKPTISTSSGETHSTLVTSKQAYGDFDVTVRMKTVAQLRTGSTPNAWERAWFLWRYVDNTDFYYLTLKATGIEIGKADPRYGGDQRFLPYYEGTNWGVGSWNTLRVRMIGATMQIWVDGVLQYAPSGGTNQTFTDSERPLLWGKFGFYTEDSEAEFDEFAMGRV
jgi:hypothetical protein